MSACPRSGSELGSARPGGNSRTPILALMGPLVLNAGTASLLPSAISRESSTSSGTQRADPRPPASGRVLGRIGRDSARTRSGGQRPGHVPGSGSSILALRHTRQGDEQDVWDRARVDDVIHFARSFDERLPRAVRAGLALAAKRSVNGERAGLYDHDRAARMRMSAGGAAGLDRDLRHGHVRSDLERDRPI